MSSVFNTILNTVLSSHEVTKTRFLRLLEIQCYNFMESQILNHSWLISWNNSSEGNIFDGQKRKRTLRKKTIKHLSYTCQFQVLSLFKISKQLDITRWSSEMFIYFSHTSGWRCTIGFLAHYHHYGMFGMQLCNLCYGLKIVIMEKYNTDEYLRLIEWHRVSFSYC